MSALLLKPLPCDAGSNSADDGDKQRRTARERHDRRVQFAVPIRPIDNLQVSADHCHQRRGKDGYRKTHYQSEYHEIHSEDSQAPWPSVCQIRRTGYLSGTLLPRVAGEQIPCQGMFRCSSQDITDVKYANSGGQVICILEEFRTEFS